MRLTSLEISGFKSFAKKDSFSFETPISAIVGPNGSGKSNVAEAFRFVLGEQSIKSMRGKKGEDLIFNGTSKIGRQNKASVKITFDNKDKLLKVDFEQVILERVVHRDGQNEYFINSSKVRLKDIHELLAGANIGSTGHHIISQGEADRILNTNPKERKEMLEDALGLRLFQYRKQDSQKKLDKTAENLAQVASLRREIAPHIRFLKKQVEKIEKSIELKKEIQDAYHDYLSKEYTYLQHSKKETSKLVEVKQKLDELNIQIEAISKRQNTDTSEVDSLRTTLEQKRSEVQSLRFREQEIGRQIAGLEGQIRTLVELQNTPQPKSIEEKIVLRKSEIESKILDLKNLQFDSIESVKQTINSLITYFESFINGEQKEEVVVQDLTPKINTFTKEVEVLNQEVVQIQSQIKDLSPVCEALQSQIQEAQKPVSNTEIIELMNQKNILTGEFSALQYKQRELDTDTEEFNREIQEAIVLVGRIVGEYASTENKEVLDEERSIQKDRRRSLERLKIRLEEIGIGASDDVMKEHQEAMERDEFLTKELTDLQTASDDLQKVIEHLNIEIKEKFDIGIQKINKQFTDFFSVMFDGGEASLKLEQKKIESEVDDEIIEEGLDIDINLPRKKVKSLMMLSGGERALTSIALLFAMSSVNPPPFIILDETDAALDEANSRRYGDMIVNLAKHSQLILITHNRETMSRAGVIFGITMADGASKVLSIKFDEAVLVAK